MNESQKRHFEIVVDNERYTWDRESITGAELRALASIPDSVLLFEHIPGKPDREIAPSTVVQLSEHRPTRFSTQAPGSQAG
jgi:hypothetical protein